MERNIKHPKTKPTFVIGGILLLVVLALFLCISSSPYRLLRPYFLFGKNIPKKLGIETINHEGRISVKIAAETGGFYIDQIPVTIGAYKKCVKNDGCARPHYRAAYERYWDGLLYRNLPVTFVTWQEARDYCQAYGGDLPTSEEWEAAAGKGKYAWGDSDPTLAKANIDGWYQSHTPAGWLPNGASPFGVLDLNGNVREWVLDTNENGEKGLKGASYQDGWNTAESANILWHAPNSSGFSRGFRCVYH